MTDSNGYDAAAVIGQMAGLATDEPRANPCPPIELIKRFCTDVPEGLVADPGVWLEKDGNTVARGFCGYSGGRGDLLETGFDDGYTFMGYLGERGWRDLPAKGDWPYVVYLLWRPTQEGDSVWAIAEYCEADLTVWLFTSKEDVQQHYRGLRDCP